MDEIRCPMCGKLNPPELENCQYCQARLKPLVVSQPSEEPESAPFSSDEEESIPDWLKDLRSQDDQKPDREEEQPAEETGEADWLKQLRDQSFTGEEEHAAGDSDVAPFINEASGLERLEKTEPQDASAAPPEEMLFAEREKEINWQSSAEPADEDELPDWLSAVAPETAPQEQGEEKFELPEVEPASLTDEPLPDWLSSLAPAEEQETPIWLPEAGSESLSTADFEADEEAAPEEDQEAAEEPGEEEVQDEEPAWIKELKADRVEDVLPIQEPGEGEEEEPGLEKAELPDWMVDLQENQAAEEAEVEELPDWLAKSEQETPPETGKAELPDWLTSLEAPEAEEAAPPEELPEWMGSLQVEEAEESLEVPVEEAEGPEQEAPPEWLAELDKEFSAEPVEESVPPFVADAVEGEEAEESLEVPLKEAAEGLEQEQTPEWLAELEKEFSSGSVEESAPSFALAEEEGEPAAPESPHLVDDQGAEFLESVPDWAAEVPIEPGVEVEGEEPTLEESELPSWLEAMRPVESIPLDFVEEEETDKQVETSGPLAGLSGILAAESDFARVRKPPAYSAKLRVTENQEARVAMLKELLAAEDKQKSLPAKPVITSRYILRLVIALALILPIAWAVISGANLTPMPDPANVPAGVLDMRQQIDDHLTPNLPVLIAVDYEAGFSSELDLPAKAVISQMMDKGAFLTFVSTSTSGPILAERLIDGLNETPSRQGNPFASYANMGYIPGGAAGLLGLAQSPRQMVPYTLNNVDIWKSAPLNALDSVADFGMVLVITENSETARAWIEQVQPFLQAKDIPLVMVVSAQAEPLVMPYYQSSPKQVNALLVGFAGGAAYDSVLGQGALARGSWDAFSLSMLLAEIILVAGALVGLGTTVLSSNKREED